MWMTNIRNTSIEIKSNNIQGHNKRSGYDAENLSLSSYVLK